MGAQLVGKVVIEYLSDERWRNLPSRTLALKIYNENKELYTSIENVRTIIRYYRGRVGDTNRGRLDRGENKQFKGTGGYNPFKLPQSDESDWFQFSLPKRCTKVLSLSDIHIPYHSIEALTKAIEYGQKKDINGIILNGDILDCYQQSRWVKDPRKRHLAEELEMCKQFLKVLRETFPDAYIFFKPGNHEERHEDYLKIKAPELLDTNFWELENLLNFAEYKIETITVNKQLLKLGKLNIAHGHEFGRSIFSPVNPARGLFLRVKGSVLAGHNHQTSEHTEPINSGLDNAEFVTTWSQGCLCELHPEYARVNKWNHGFAYIEINDDEGNYYLNNIRLV